MNYLGHLYLAGRGASPEFMWGSMAPDFVGMVGSKLHRIQQERRGYLDRQHRAVQEGIDHHMTVDAAMGELALVTSLKESFRGIMRDNYPQVESNVVRVGNELGTDLMFDGWIICNYPETLDSFCQTIGWCEDSMLMYPAMGYSRRIIRLARDLEHSTPNYDDTEVLAQVIWRRTRGRKSAFHISNIAYLAAALSMHKAEVYAVAPEVFDQIDRGVNEGRLFTNRGECSRI